MPTFPDVFSYAELRQSSTAQHLHIPQNFFRKPLHTFSCLPFVYMPGPQVTRQFDQEWNSEKKSREN